MIRNHQPPEKNIWVVAAADEVRYERKPTGYLGWLWCTDGKGNSAWAPERWVTIISSDRCRFLRDYDASELAVEIGQIVEGEIMESGWIQVCDTSKKSGWIPLECVEEYIDL